MSDGIMLSICDDGIAREYDDTYDITIHCESEEEQEEVKRALKSISHWIPVTERLPEKCNTAYLATIDYGKYGLKVGYRFFFGDNIGWNDKAVLAWMPAPEPYKGVTT